MTEATRSLVIHDQQVNFNERQTWAEKECFACFLYLRVRAALKGLDVGTTSRKILNAFLPMTDFSTCNFCQVMTIAMGQTVTCIRSEDACRYPEEIGLSAQEREYSLHGIPG